MIKVAKGITRYKGCTRSIKKSHRYSGKLTEVIYTAITDYKREMEQLPKKHRISVSGILKQLGVSRSGYHAWLKRVPSNTNKRTDDIKEQIHEIYEPFHPIYGAPKIAAELWKAGETISVKAVGNYVRDRGICAHWVKPYTCTTIPSDFSNSLQNRLDELFNPDTPNTVQVSDITYIWAVEGFVYVTSIMDLFSRKIISWVLSRTLEAIHIVDAVEKAKESRPIDQPFLFHSDRGCQFISERFLKATEGMTNSYSKKAYPWDNAWIESFHALSKREWINWFKIINYGHAYKLILEYVETFYNTVRSHSQCGYLSPNEYGEDYLQKLEKAVCKVAS